MEITQKEENGIVSISIKGRLDADSSPEAEKVVKEALEAVTFFEAMFRFDRAEFDQARTGLSEYLKQHPAGRWEPTARALLAETLLATGSPEDAAEAARLFAALPKGRRLYGLMRLKKRLHVDDLRPLP